MFQTYFCKETHENFQGGQKILGLKKSKKSEVCSKSCCRRTDVCVWTSQLTYPGVNFHSYWLKDVAQRSPRSPLAGKV